MRFFKALLSGVFIGIGGTVFLACESKIVGALFFTFALLSVLNFRCVLYTGQIGYFLDYDTKKKLSLPVVLLWNLLGTVLVAALVRFSGLTSLQDRILALDTAKFSCEWYEMIFRSLLCGVMMVIAVEGFKKAEAVFVKNLIVILSVSIFVISGFEHSVANMFYYFYGLMSGLSFEFRQILLLVLSVFGNSVGSVLMYNLMKLAEKKPAPSAP